MQNTIAGSRAGFPQRAYAMTYCLAISIDQGLVFASDSRTNAGVDQVSTYSKMHTFGGADRQFVLLCAGNLATTQSVVAQLRRELAAGGAGGLAGVTDMARAAEHLGGVIREQGVKHGEAVAAAGISADATFIIGGQVGREPPRIFLVYPQGNYITTSQHTRFLQLGEAKYGKAILDRIVHPGMSLDQAARCALVSLDSTMRSNVTVGPPLEVLSYERDSLRLANYLCLHEDDPYLLALKKSWNEKLTRAFAELPRFEWGRYEAEGAESGGTPA